jgi:hypothetical protein
MTVATDALLVYGYDLGSIEEWKVNQVDDIGELSVPWYQPDTDDFSEVLCQHLLTFTPPGRPGGGGDADAGADGGAGETEVMARCGIELVLHCSLAVPRYVLSAKTITAARGELVTVDVAALAVERRREDWDGRLLRALDVLGLTPLQPRPVWLLCSFWEWDT